MKNLVSMAVVTGVLAAAGNALAQGTAIVKVETVPPGTPVSVTFTGVPAGTVTAGGSIEKAGLTAGRYSSTAAGTPAGLALVSISCNDDSSASPSSGDVPTSTATFNIDPDESVTCIFRYGSGIQGAASGGGGTSSPDGTSGGGSCTPPNLVPKAGRWQVANRTGSMVCGTMINMPLKASQEDGMLEISDCGWTVRGTGMTDDTAPLTMHAVDATSGRYTGSVGGEQDGIPMMIDFNWQLNSEESIDGDLRSEVTQQGMTCIMTRPFELRYIGG